MNCFDSKPKFFATKLILSSLYLMIFVISFIDLIYFTPKHNSLLFISDFPSVLVYYSAFVVFLVNVFVIFSENSILLMISTTFTAVLVVVMPALIREVMPCLLTYFNLLLIIIVSIVYIVKIQTNDCAVSLLSTNERSHTITNQTSREVFASE